MLRLMRILAALLVAGLILAPALSRAQSDLKTVSTKELGKRWQDKGDVDAARELIARARAAAPGQTEALQDLDGGWVRPPAAMALVADDLEALAHEKAGSSDPLTRQFAGSLGQMVVQWRNFDSPQALAGKRRYERQERLDQLEGDAMMLSIPVLSLVGLVWVIVSRGFFIGLLLGSSKALSRAFGDAGAVAEREHRAVMLLPTAAAVTAVVLGITLWKAVSLVTPTTTNAGVNEVLWKAILSGRVLFAYFSAGFVFFFMHAMFLTMMIAVARGGRPDFAAAFSAAARRWRDILLLSLAVFGGILVVEILTELAAKKASGWRRPVANPALSLLGLASWLVKTGITMASVVTLAIAMGDGVGLVDAARRATRILVVKARPAVLSMLGIEAAGGEAVASVTGLLFIGGFCGVPILAPLLFPSTANFAGDPRMSMYLFVYFPMAFGIVGGALMYSGLLALESIFGAAMYSYASDDAVQGPLYDLLRRVEPGLGGVLARVTPAERALP